VLLVVFGSVVAGLVPLLLALVSIVVALALAALVGQALLASRVERRLADQPTETSETA